MMRVAIRALAGTAALAALILAGCTEEEGETTDPDGGTGETPMSGEAFSRLADGPHIGLWTGTDTLSDSQTAQVDTLRQDARDAGLSIVRVEFDWATLEPSAGRFDRDVLRDALVEATEGGAAPWVLVSTFGTGGFTFPPDLMNADGTDLRDDLAINGALAQSRFESLLRWLLPELEAFDVWGLSIANEPESVFPDRPESFRGAALDFLSQSLGRVQFFDSDIAAMVTLGPYADLDEPDFVSEIVDVSNAVALNYLCLDRDLIVTDRNDWSEDFTRYQTAFADRPILFQTLGCPVGDRTNPATSIGGSSGTQLDFFDFTLGQVVETEQFRAASIFQLHDVSPERAAEIAAASQAGDDAEAGRLEARLEEALRTVGLCDWPDFDCRPAYGVALDRMTDARIARP